MKKRYVVLVAIKLAFVAVMIIGCSNRKGFEPPDLPTEQPLIETPNLPDKPSEPTGNPTDFSSGNPPEPDLELLKLQDCSIDFFGTWKVIAFMPNALKVMGVLQTHKYLSIARDALGAEIEYQFDYYMFNGLKYYDFEYISSRNGSSDQW